MNFIIRTKLAREKPDQADALRVRYVYPDGALEKLLHEKHISERTFFYRLSNAKQWLTRWVKEDHFFDDYL